MEFDLHSNMMVDKQSIIDWSFIGDSFLIPEISKVFSDVDALAPLPETIYHPYDHNSSSLYPFPTTMASDLNETFEVVPLFPTLVSNMATIMDNGEFFMEKTLPDQYSTTENYNKMEELREVTERKETGKSRLANISYDEIKKYFSVPITRAAKELNVGLTILKRRCRELGIPRWPHRKIKSLKSLISNVQELGKESATESVIKELQMLENHKKLMEDNPEIQLTERTKKLRQACFKANYKKRRARASHHYH